MLLPQKNGKTITLKRIFDARPEKVWEAWTNPRHITEWWGAKGISTQVVKHDFSVGGDWKYRMIDGERNEYLITGTFSHILVNKKIITSDHFLDQGYLSSPRELSLTFELHYHYQTKLTLDIKYASHAEKESHLKMGVLYGWSSSFDKLQTYLIIMGI